jgi:hypothetical protein
VLAEAVKADLIHPRRKAVGAWEDTFSGRGELGRRAEEQEIKGRE